MSLDPQLLQLAIAKGKTQWLEEYLTKHLPSLDSPTANYQAWFDHFIQTLESRGLSQPSQQKNYLTNVRNAIKVLDPNHPALEIVKFATETWIEINEADRDRLAERTTKLINDPDAIVSKAIELLKTNSWSDLAAGLAVVTGRRCGEVLKTAQFEFKTQYSVTFRGALKRRNEAPQLVFEIPTLCRSDLVIAATANLRLQLGDEIKSLSATQINQRYEERVANKCELHFSALVPPRDNGESLYTHLFRGIYAGIASFWYCPIVVPEMEYKSAIQGHFKILNEKSDKLRRTLASLRNYLDYKIADATGNIDGRLGIKLSLPEVEVIEYFQQHSRVKQKPLGLNPRQSSTNRRTNRNKDSVNRTKSSPKPKSTAMNRSDSLNGAVVSLQLSLSRLENFSKLLDLSHSQAIATLVDWAEAGASLAKHFDLDNSTPEALTSHVLDLEQSYASASSNSQPQSLSSVGKGQPSSVSIEDHQRLILTVSSLSNSVEFLTRALIEGKSGNGIVEAYPSVNSSSPPRSNSRSIVSSSVPNTSQANSNKEPSSPNGRTSQASSQNEAASKNQSQSIIAPTEIRERDTPEVTAEDIHNAINAVMDFNDEPERPHKQKFRLSVKPISDLTGRATNSVSKILKERGEEIEEHHQQHKISVYHNKSRKDERGNSYSPIESEPEIDYQQLTEVNADLPVSVTSQVSKDRERDTTEVMEQDINNALDAVMDFNDEPERPHKQKFRLAVNPIRELTGRANNSIAKVLNDRAEEIEEHHEYHQLGMVHNRGRKDERGVSYPPIESEPEIDYQPLTEVNAG